MHPARPKLADLVAQELLAGIREGRWHGSLPPERRLAGELKCGRSTLQSALHQLEQDGHLTAVPGSGHRILARASAPRGRVVRRVCLLWPGPAADPGPWRGLHRDTLQAALAARSIALDVVAAPPVFRAPTARNLQALVSHQQADGWILRLAPRFIQAWFETQGLPTVVAGSTFPGIDLPRLDVDHAAVVRHALARLRRQGHRRLALLVPQAERAGDELGVATFLQNAPSDETREVIRHDVRPEIDERDFRRRLRRADRPTAWIVAHPPTLLTLHSAAARLGMVAPRDFSMICLQEADWLPHLRPTPGHYHLDAPRYQASLLRLVVARLADERPRPARLLIPTFVPGSASA